MQEEKLKKKGEKKPEISRILESTKELSVDDLMKIVLIKKLVEGGADISKYLLLSKILE